MSTLFQTKTPPKAPYADDALWLGDQFHQYLDTTKYANGRYLLVLELFDKNGNRLIPAGAPADPGDTATNFTFLRWLTASRTGSYKRRSKNRPHYAAEAA